MDLIKWLMHRDWETEGMYNVDSSEMAMYDEELNNYWHYVIGFLFRFLLVVTGIFVIGIIINLLVLGSIPMVDVTNAILFYIGVNVGTCLGSLLVLGKIKEKLKRGY